MKLTFKGLTLEHASRRSQVALEEEEEEKDITHSENEISAQRETFNIKYNNTEQKVKYNIMFKEYLKKRTDEETSALIYIGINYEILYNSNHDRVAAKVIEKVITNVSREVLVLVNRDRIPNSYPKLKKN